MTSQNTKRTLAEFAAKNVPDRATVELVVDEETIELTVRRLPLAELLAIEGMREMMNKDEEQDDETDFESAADEKGKFEKLAEQLPTMERLIAATTGESVDDLAVIPLAAKAQLFTFCFQFQRISGGEFRGSR